QVGELVHCNGDGRKRNRAVCEQSCGDLILCAADSLGSHQHELGNDKSNRQGHIANLDVSDDHKARIQSAADGRADDPHQQGARKCAISAGRRRGWWWWRWSILGSTKLWIVRHGGNISRERSAAKEISGFH